MLNWSQEKYSLGRKRFNTEALCGFMLEYLLLRGLETWESSLQ